MKALKIIFAITLPVAIVIGLVAFIYPLIELVNALNAIASEGGTSILDFFKAYVESFGQMIANLDAVMKALGFGFIVYCICTLLSPILFLVWLVFAIIKRRPIGILYAFIALIVLALASLGVFISTSVVAAGKAAESIMPLPGVADDKVKIFELMIYFGLASAILFVCAIVVHIMIMFKVAKARKAEKAAKRAAEQRSNNEAFEIDYNDLPPVLFEKTSPDVKPDVILHHDDSIKVGPNHVLKGYYVRDDEIQALLASDRFNHEEEIPESILEFLDAKHRAETSGKTLPMFDPDFVASHDDVLTEEERFVIEALRNYRAQSAVEEVPDRVHAFLERGPQAEAPVDERVVAFLNREEKAEPVEPLGIFDPSFVPEKKEPKVLELSPEELRVVKAMSVYQPKKDEGEYIDLPFFREHEEPVEYVEEIIRVEEPEEAVDAPKLASAKPVHVSKNQAGKYQLKQVGENRALAVFETEDEAIRYAEALKKVNGVSVRVHDDEGKIRSL